MMQHPQYDEAINALVEQLLLPDNTFDPEQLDYVFDTLLDRLCPETSFMRECVIVGVLEMVKQKYLPYKLRDLEEVVNVEPKKRLTLENLRNAVAKTRTDKDEGIIDLESLEDVEEKPEKVRDYEGFLSDPPA